MRYFILGATEARDEQGRAVPLGGARLRALLAALALRPGRAVAVADLVAEVWADDPPQDSPAALQALVGRLRRALGKDAVVSAPGGYRLAASRAEVDLYAFERLGREGAAQLAAGDAEAAAGTLREALALWRGPALDDLPGRSGGGDHGVRLQAQRFAVLRQRIEADLRRGASGDVLPELAGLAGDHPYDEPLQAQFLRALRAEGRGADALAAYERTRRALAEGLGTDPGAELAALHAELLAAPVPGRPPAGAPAVPGAAGDPSPGPDAVTVPADPIAADGNIRPRLTSFVGRQADIQAVCADLDRARLVTLLGPGGAGKTRLAEEAAPPGAWLVELAPLDHPSAVPGAVLSALGLRETQLASRDERGAARQGATELLVEHLGRRRLLLVLDNCEHVVGAAAELAEVLLTRCPGLTVLATSREPLGVPGEVVRPVGSLGVDAAFRLFGERGGAVRPGFDPGVDAAAVGEICRRLDGLPLAIELAAARLRVLSPRQIADRLDDRFRLLSRGSRTVLPRQQTLRAVVDWSWDLLDAGERAVLRRLSVFAGGWDLTAAEAVCAAPAGPAGDEAVRDAPGGVPGAVPEVPADVPALLGALVDKSLVVAAPGGDDGMRYRMLETIHEYASERAAEEPCELAAAERAHSAYFTAFAEHADPLLRSAGQLPWIRRVETELDNIRAVLDRTVAAGDEQATQRMLFAVCWFWWLRNYRTESLRRVEQALALGSEPAGEDDPRFWPYRSLQLLRVFLLSDSGGLESFSDAVVAGDAVTPREIVRTFGRPGPHSARFPGMLWGLFGYFLDDDADHRRMMDDAMANVRRYGGAWETAVLLMGRAHVLIDQPDGIKEADACLAELSELGSRVGDRWILAQVAGATAEAAMARGQFEKARRAYEESLRYAGEVGAHAEPPFLLVRLAELSFRAGDEDAAEKSLAEAVRAAERTPSQDTEAFIGLLRAMLAIGRREVAEARRAIDASKEAARRGTLPPQFDMAAATVEARIASYEEEGPHAAVRSLARVLKDAVAGRFGPVLLAQAAEAAVPILLRAGEPARAVRALAAGEVWRGEFPRSVPERREASGAQAAARAALGSAACAAERTAGGRLTPSEVADDLASLPDAPAAGAGAPPGGPDAPPGEAGPRL